MHRTLERTDLGHGREDGAWINEDDEGGGPGAPEAKGKGRNRAPTALGTPTRMHGAAAHADSVGRSPCVLGTTRAPARTGPVAKARTSAGEREGAVLGGQAVPEHAQRARTPQGTRTGERLGARGEGEGGNRATARRRPMRERRRAALQCALPVLPSRRAGEGQERDSFAARADRRGQRLEIHRAQIIRHARACQRGTTGRLAANGGGAPVVRRGGRAILPGCA